MSLSLPFETSESTTMDDIQRTVGNFEAKIDRLERDVSTLIKNQNEMLQILHQARGGWKVMVMAEVRHQPRPCCSIRLLVTSGPCRDETQRPG